MNSYIIVALLAFIGYRIYNNFAIPKHFANVPKISFFDRMTNALKNTYIRKFHDEIVWPIICQKGYALSWFQGRWTILVAQPEFAKKLFRQTTVFHKVLNSNPHTLVNKFLGVENIVFSNDDRWKRLRKPANPIFHHSFPSELFSESVKDVLNEIERCQQQGTKSIPVTELMEWMTLDVLGKGIFDYNFDAVRTRGQSKIQLIYSNISKSVANPLYFMMPALDRFPFGERKELHKDVKKFNNFMGSMVNERRMKIKQGEYQDAKDLLTTLLRHNMDEKESEALSDEELIHNMNIFFIAGHDTTANTLSYAMYYLAKYPQVQQKLRNEIRSVLNPTVDNKEVVVPTFEQIKEMEYLGYVISETMRKAPAVIQINRVIEENVTLDDGLVIPKGTQVGLSLYSILNDPKVYPNPHEFIPERFAEGKYDTDIYAPFGGGSRMCIGKNFSLNEQKMYLSMVLQKYLLEIPQDSVHKDELLFQGATLTRADHLLLNFQPL